VKSVNSKKQITVYLTSSTALFSKYEYFNRSNLPRTTRRPSVLVTWQFLGHWIFGSHHVWRDPGPNTCTQPYKIKKIWKRAWQVTRTSPVVTTPIDSNHSWSNCIFTDDVFGGATRWTDCRKTRTVVSGAGHEDQVVLRHRLLYRRTYFSATMVRSYSQMLFTHVSGLTFFCTATHYSNPLQPDDPHLKLD